MLAPRACRHPGPFNHGKPMGPAMACGKDYASVRIRKANPSGEWHCRAALMPAAFSPAIPVR